MLDRSIFDAIKRSVTSRDVAQALGLEVGRNGKARCLWHSDRHPSMKLYDGDRGCWCFACNHGGSVIDMVMQAHGCSTQEAVTWLNDVFDLRLNVGGELDEKAAQKARQAADEHRRKQEEIQAEEQNLLDIINECEALLGDLNDKIKRLGPKREGDEWSEEFTEALRLQEIAQDALDSARNNYEAIRKAGKER